MEEALRAYLLGDSDIVELIVDRIYWNVRTQGEGLPAIVLTRISGKPGLTYKGSDGLWRSRVQVNCLGASNASARGLERAVRARLNAKAFEQDGIAFQGCFLDSVRDLTETGTTDAETIYCPSTDYIILYEEQ